MQKTQPGEDAIAKTSLQMLLACGPRAVAAAPTSPMQVSCAPSTLLSGELSQ